MTSLMSAGQPKSMPPSASSGVLKVKSLKSIEIESTPTQTNNRRLCPQSIYEPNTRTKPTRSPQPSPRSTNQSVTNPFPPLPIKATDSKRISHPGKLSSAPSLLGLSDSINNEHSSCWSPISRADMCCVVELKNVVPSEFYDVSILRSARTRYVLSSDIAFLMSSERPKFRPPPDDSQNAIFPPSTIVIESPKSTQSTLSSIIGQGPYQQSISPTSSVKRFPPPPPRRSTIQVETSPFPPPPPKATKSQSSNSLWKSSSTSSLHCPSDSIGKQRISSIRATPPPPPPRENAKRKLASPPPRKRSSKAPELIQTNTPRFMNTRGN